MVYVGCIIMTKYYKIVIDNLIPGFGTNGPDKFENLVPIKAAEYKKLQDMMAKRPDPGKADPDMTYILQNDPLEWVQVKIPADQEEKDKKEE